jgi:multidrug efflux pump subunit AcrA (membrane-fusion protein)
MSDDKQLKSAYELAMERLNKADAQAGVEPRRLTDEQKASIAELKRFYEAKLAEQELLHQSSLRKTMDPEARATLEDEYRRDRERLVSERDAKLEKVRQGV